MEEFASDGVDGDNEEGEDVTDGEDSDDKGGEEWAHMTINPWGSGGHCSR